MDQVRLIKLFSCFPSDVSQEAKLLDTVTDRLNRTAGQDLGYRLEVLRWDRDVVAGVGGDVQEVISRQLNGKFEILVATFWARAGTPTPRGDSGSIEEVKAAVVEHKSGGGIPLVMVYMKTLPLDPTRIDAEQLSVLQRFKDWLGENGVLYKSFKDPAEFENLLLIELSTAVRTFVTSLSKELVEVDESRPDSSPPEEIDQDELGFLDYMDIQEAAFADLTDLMEEQAASLNQMTERTQANRMELSNLNDSGIKPPELRRIIKRGAEIWDAYSEDAEKRISKLELAANEGFSAMARAIALNPGNDQESRQAFRVDILALIETIKEAAHSVEEMKSTMEQFPRMTVESNRSKKKLVAVLQKNIEHYQRVLRLANAVLEAIPPNET